MSDNCGLECCGLAELAGIQYDKTPDKTLKLLIDYWYSDREEWDPTTKRYVINPRKFRPDACHLIFSDANDRDHSYGDELMKFIRAHRLGRVIKTKGATNPNSGNTIECYVWTPNMKNLEAYAKKNCGDKNV